MERCTFDEGDDLMPTSTKIVEGLIARGLIPAEFKDVAVRELHRELSRRSKRVCLALATMVSVTQFATRVAENSLEAVC